MKTHTVFDELVRSLEEAGVYNRDDQERPAAILWPDKDREWLPAIALLKRTMPHLFVYGEYVPEQQKGPAIWLKCVIAHALPNVKFPDRAVPIIYLPGVGRSDLRAVNQCPLPLQPLAEIQYRGVFWSQRNGKDWTVLAFLSSKIGGLGLDVALDSATHESMLRSLEVLVGETIISLQGRRLEAGDFDTLRTPDSDRDMLVWMDEPEGTRSEWGEERWESFCRLAKHKLGLDPEKDGPLSAAEKLARHEGAWKKVWVRYAESASRYLKIIGLLERIPMPADLFTDPSAYPKVNENEENDLRKNLETLTALRPTEARLKLLELEARHAERREWIWSELGRSPLAKALKPLAQIAKDAEQTFHAPTPKEMAKNYADLAWEVDAAMVDALAAAHTTSDTLAVETALRAVYVPWLEDLANRFQQVVKANGYQLDIKKLKKLEVKKGLCILFVDGLRFDAGQRLAKKLIHQGAKVEVESEWSSIPSVTASGKVLASPVAVLAVGEPENREFEPVHKVEKKPFNSAILRKALESEGWQVLSSGETGNPATLAWTEIGDIDHRGHSLQLRLAKDINEQLDAIAERIKELMDAGWNAIRVVTDHGWLLVPGKMSKIELPKDHTDTRWGRCAILKIGAPANPLTFNWTWNGDVSVAMAPGISSFIAGYEYAHGGLSLQESVIPVLNVTAGKTGKREVVVKKAIWSRLVLRVEVETSEPSLYADIRTKATAKNTSRVELIHKIENGKVSLAAVDDSEGEAAFLVIYDESGRVLAQQPVTIGG